MCCIGLSTTQLRLHPHRMIERHSVKITTYAWAGIRTTDFDGTVRFFTELFGTTPVLHSDKLQFATFQINDVQRFEIFGPKSKYYPLHECPVLGFLVDDVAATHREFEARGIDFVTEVEYWTDGSAWCYLRGPDGYLYEISQRGPTPA